MKKCIKLTTSLSIISNTKYQTQQTLSLAFLLQQNFGIAGKSKKQAKRHE